MIRIDSVDNAYFFRNNITIFRFFSSTFNFPPGLIVPGEGMLSVYRDTLGSNLVVLLDDCIVP